MELTITRARVCDMTGGQLQGYVHATRKQLERYLGKPLLRDGQDKVTTEWILNIGGTIVWVYDYKEASRPGPNESYAWHIGGHGKSAVIILQHVLRDADVQMQY